MLDATPLLRLYARARLRALARQNAAETQTRQLLSLLTRAAATKFGRDHNFAGIRSVDDFQRAVPLRRYDDFWRDYWRQPFPTLNDISWPGLVPYFAYSSGTTTGVTKNIPLSHEMMRANRRAAIDILVHHVANRPRSRVLAGGNFMLGSSAALQALAPGVDGGDLSGIAASQIPRWAKARFFPPLPLACISDWEEKVDRLARASLDADIRSIGGTPSWLLPFFENLRTLKPGSERLRDWYPDLELVTHGGVNFAPYRAQFDALLEGSRAETREVYAASEGFIAVADRAPADGMRLILDNGLFFEFVPVDEIDAPSPTRHWLATAETGVNYAIVLTTCAGLWSYVIGDTVRFVSLDPPRILVTGRTSWSLSAFGEHLIGEEIENAVSAAAAGIDAAVTDFSVGPVYPQTLGQAGYHLYLVEFARADVGEDQIEQFARTIDSLLIKANIDYEAHRAGDFGMLPPKAVVVAPGAFAAWMKSRGKLGGQNKVPRIVSDAQAFKDMVAAVQAAANAQSGG